ncbi:MAG: tol-pal system YbgF family protein [Fidelibacterota bacterium]
MKILSTMLSGMLLLGCGGDSSSESSKSELSEGTTMESTDNKLKVRVRADDVIENLPDVSSLEEYQLAPADLISQAEQLRDHGKYLDAIKKLDILLESYPDAPESPDAQFLIAQIYMGYQNDFASSVREFREVITKYPQSEQAKNAQFMLGYIYSNHLGEKELARTEFQRFIDLYSEEVEKYFLESAKAELKSLDEGEPTFKVFSE